MARVQNCSEQYLARCPLGLVAGFISQHTTSRGRARTPCPVCREDGSLTLPRYPEVRQAFSQVLKGSRGYQFSSALRDRLYSLDPKTRYGAAIILVTSDPKTDAEALFVAVRSRAKEGSFDWHEWESFCLTLDFAPSVLVSLKDKLSLLEPNARAFAYILLEKGGFKADISQKADLLTALLNVGNWHLTSEFTGDLFDLLLEQLDHPPSDKAERAANLLLQGYRSRLTPKAEAKCIAICTKHNDWNLPKIMLRIAQDSDFASVIGEACDEILARGGPRPFLHLVSRANKEPSAWRDVVWVMLCDDEHDGGSSEAEQTGQSLLEYGHAMIGHRQSIGQAAREFLSDPRMKMNRWADAYHWLAVIADEFVGLTPESIRNAIKRGQPIYAAAATALIARLGEVPEGVAFSKRTQSRPAPLSGGAPRVSDPDSIIKNLTECSRNSDVLYPGLLDLLEDSLLLPALDENLVAELASKGNAGILIAIALRFCFGLPPRLEEAIPLLDSGSSVWHSDENRPDEKQLLEVWKIERETVLRHDKVALDNISRHSTGSLLAEKFGLCLWRGRFSGSVGLYQGNRFEKYFQNMPNITHLCTPYFFFSLPNG